MNFCKAYFEQWYDENEDAFNAETNKKNIAWEGFLTGIKLADETSTAGIRLVDTDYRKTETPVARETPTGKEPTDKEIFDYVKKHPGESHYSARETLRERAYGGKPPDGFQSWGDYWKAY